MSDALEQAGQEPDREEAKADEDEAAIGDGQIMNRRELIKNRLEVVRLELALLREIHGAGHAREGEGAISHHGKRRVQFQPRIHGQVRRCPGVGGQEQCDHLDDKDQR